MFQLGDKAEITAVFVTSPNEFWCHINRNIEAIEQLGEKMAKTYSVMGPGDGLLLNLRPGSTCAVFSSTDSTWYRAVIEKVSKRGSNISHCLADADVNVFMVW